MRGVFAGALLFAGTAFAQVPDRLVNDALQAEQRGLELFRAQAKGCDGPYRTVTVRGVAYRVTERCIAAQETAESASAGGTRPDKLVLASMQNAAPTAFHVFLSLKHDVPVFVATRSGIWKVEAGLVRYLGSR